MPAILATRFQSHTASSFIASKLSSHRWVASQAHAKPVGPNLFGKGLVDSILLLPDMTHSRMNSLPPRSTLAGQHRTSHRQPSQADRKIPVGAGLARDIGARFHGYNALSFFAGKLSSHRDQPLQANIESSADNRLRRIATPCGSRACPRYRRRGFMAITRYRYSRASSAPTGINPCRPT